MTMKNIVLDNNERIDDLNLDGLKLIQNKEYFCFGTDSVLLANFVNSNKSNNIIDFCSGSGVIALIISKKKACNNIFAVELQKEMYNLLNRNIELNNLNNKIFAINKDIKNIKGIREDILEKSKNGTVDIIVCNPPYKIVGSGVKNQDSVKYIARHEVLCNLEDIFCSSSKLLNTKGKLYIVHKPERLSDLISLARKYRLEPKRIRFVQPNIKLKPSIVLIEYVKDGKNEIIVEKNLIEYEQNGNYTEEFLNIYDII